MTDNLTFTLSAPLKVQLNVEGKNDFVEISTFYLSAPSFRHKDHTINLKKKFIEAVFAMTSSLQKEEAQKQVNDEGGKLDAKAIKAILFAAKDFDILSFFKKFEAFLLSEICFKDSDMKQKITNLELQKLDESDFEELLAKYLEVFFITSWMKTLN